MEPEHDHLGAAPGLEGLEHLAELAELHPGAGVDHLLERRVGLVHVGRRHHPVAGAARALGEEEREASAAGDEADGGHA